MLTSQVSPADEIPRSLTRRRGDGRRPLPSFLDAQHIPSILHNFSLAYILAASQVAASGPLSPSSCAPDGLHNIPPRSDRVRQSYRAWGAAWPSCCALESHPSYRDASPGGGRKRPGTVGFMVSIRWWVVGRIIRVLVVLIISFILMLAFVLNNR